MRKSNAGRASGGGEVILDFEFWILDWVMQGRRAVLDGFGRTGGAWSNRRSLHEPSIQNPKSKIQNHLGFALVATVALALFAAGGGAVGQEALSPGFIQEQYDKVTPALCLIQYSAEITNPGSGESTKRDVKALGLIVSADGLVMTHGHMQIENTEPSNIKVTVGQGEKQKEYGAKFLRKPDDVNVCFVRITHDEPLSLPHVTFARGVALRLGEPLLLFGMLSETLDYWRSVNVRRVGAILDKPRMTYCLDERVPFGMVDAPVVDGEGRVVGVVGFDLTTTEGGEVYLRSGHPLVYQGDLFVKYIDKPPSETEVPESKAPAWLGVFTQALTDDLAEYWGLPKEGGVVVSSIMGGSPADTAGLKRGDVIMDVNGTPLKAKQEREVLAFSKLVRDMGVGASADLKLVRGGKPMELKATLVERPKPASEAEEYADEAFGLTVRELTTDVRIFLNLSEDVGGVIVRRVKSGSWADAARMRPGVIILNFGDYPTTSLEEFKQAVAKVAEKTPKEVSVFCRVGSQTGFFRIQPRWEEVQK